MRSAKGGGGLREEIHQIVTFISICDGNMQEDRSAWMQVM